MPLLKMCTMLCTPTARRSCSLTRVLLSEYPGPKTEEDPSMKRVIEKVKYFCADYPTFLEVLIVLESRENNYASEVLKTLKKHMTNDDDFVTKLFTISNSSELANIRETALQWLLARYPFATMRKIWNKLTSAQVEHFRRQKEATSTVDLLFEFIEHGSAFYAELDKYWKARCRPEEVEKWRLCGTVGGAVSGLVTGAAAGAYYGGQAGTVLGPLGTTGGAIAGAVIGGLICALIGCSAAEGIYRITCLVEDWLNKPNEEAISSAYKLMGVDMTATREELQANFIKVLGKCHTEAALANVLLKKVTVECFQVVS